MPGPPAAQSLPKGRYLASLAVLDLEGNRFTSIPPALAAARQIVHLDLSCNQVRSPVPSACSRRPHHVAAF
jgi:Leucine-rich repeat (LRR) protein